MSAHAEAIVRHLERHVGRIRTSLAEIVPGDPPLTVHHVASTLFRRYELLVTSGMSARPMPGQPDDGSSRWAELLVLLPKGWPLTRAAFDDEDHYWPIRLLKTLARLPHEQDTWLGYGHTVANGSDEGTMEAYAPGTRLCAAAILPSMTLGEAMWRLPLPGGGSLHFWAVVPLHASELAYKREHGIDALLERFDAAGVGDRIDPRRRSAVPGG